MIKALISQRGVTLIELIVAIGIVVGLLVASASLYSLGLRQYAKDKIVQQVQRETDAVVNSFSTNLRESVTVNAGQSNLATNPNTLTVDIPGNLTRKYYVSGSQLHYVNESGIDLNLLSPGTTVTSLSFVPTTAVVNDQTVLKSLAVTMTLSRTKLFQTSALTTNTTIGTRPQ